MERDPEEDIEWCSDDDGNAKDSGPEVGGAAKGDGGAPAGLGVDPLLKRVEEVMLEKEKVEAELSKKNARLLVAQEELKTVKATLAAAQMEAAQWKGKYEKVKENNLKAKALVDRLNGQNKEKAKKLADLEAKMRAGDGDERLEKALGALWAILCELYYDLKNIPITAPFTAHYDPILLAADKDNGRMWAGESSRIASHVGIKLNNLISWAAARHKFSSRLKAMLGVDTADTQGPAKEEKQDKEEKPEEARAEAGTPEPAELPAPPPAPGTPAKDQSAAQSAKEAPVPESPTTPAGASAPPQASKSPSKRKMEEVKGSPARSDAKKPRAPSVATAPSPSRGVVGRMLPETSRRDAKSRSASLESAAHAALDAAAKQKGAGTSKNGASDADLGSDEEEEEEEEDDDDEEEEEEEEGTSRGGKRADRAAKRAKKGKKEGRTSVDGRTGAFNKARAEIMKMVALMDEDGKLPRDATFISDGVDMIKAGTFMPHLLDRIHFLRRRWGKGGLELAVAFMKKNDIQDFFNLSKVADWNNMYDPRNPNKKYKDPLAIEISRVMEEFRTTRKKLVSSKAK